MLTDLASVLHDWRYPCMVLFTGSYLGYAVYRLVPAPKSVQEHLQRLVRAGVVGMAAHETGQSGMETLSRFVGLAEAGAIVTALKRQSRMLLLLSLTIAAAGGLIVFSALSDTRVLPDWLFAVLGVAGVRRVWLSW